MVLYSLQKHFLTIELYWQAAGNQWCLQVQIRQNLMSQTVLSRLAIFSAVLFVNLLTLNGLDDRRKSQGDEAAVSSRFSLLDSLGASANAFPIRQLPPTTLGARIDERRVTQTLFVNNSLALPTNAQNGSRDRPFRTIQQALSTARSSLLAGRGVRIIISPGTYREQLYLEGNGGNSGPLVIQAAAVGRVIISGADVFRSWKPVQGMPGVYQHTWRHNWGTIENPWREQFAQGKESAYPDFRREMFYINNRPLSQVLRAAALRPGSFFVDEAADRVLLRVPNGMNINAVTVEGAMRSVNQDFGILKLENLNNVVLRGLTITEGATAIWGAARLGGNNILIEDSNFDRNNGMGLTLTGDRITIRRTTANENGHAGIHKFGGTSILFENVEASWNGWKMKEWGYEDCSGAGIKFVDVRNTLVRSVKVVGNSYPGLWFDEGARNVTVDNVLAFANESAGFDWEISDNLRITRLYSVYNQFGWRSYDGSRVSLQNSVIAYNRSLQIFTANTERNYETENWTVRGVTIAADGLNRNLLWDTWPQSPGSFQANQNNTMDRFASTLRASSNVYFHPWLSAAFRKGSGSPLSLQQWRSYTGQEVGSQWNRIRVEATMASLKLDIQNKWGVSNTVQLGYHRRPRLPW